MDLKTWLLSCGGRGGILPLRSPPPPDLSSLVSFLSPSNFQGFDFSGCGNLVHQEDVDAIEVQRPKLLLLVHLESLKRHRYRASQSTISWLAHRPERVHEHQWRALVYYWGTRKARKKAKKNKRIRKKKTLHHRTGRKPFAVVRLEETNRNKGVPASRMQVWKAAYLKEGSVASDAVNQVMTQMTELSTQMEGSSTESTCIDEDIFVKVMGPEQPGRVRTFGLGPSIKDVFGGGYRRSQEQTHIFQAQMQEQFQLYRVQFETQMKEMMETQMAAMRTQMDATIQAQAATIQAQQTRMEYLESQLVTRGGPAAREAAWGHHPMSRPQQNSHEFTSSSSHQKVAQSKTKTKSKSKRRPHI
ncbi:hypothetical protein RHMOL_Rhmol02G0172000 [Rhododendron molle]|uniref:Uncharacterized protein n=1 Tax=Rhododendron molle TaxID=49168 RepID=A0ACC0PSJ7_RHOML|nr:hypothetical protein RHMOL_Rhmol02G0172000 [Rhododendron molle]